MPERSLWYYITAAGAAIGAVIYWAQDIAVAFDKIDQVVRRHFLPPEPSPVRYANIVLRDLKWTRLNPCRRRGRPFDAVSRPRHR